MARSLAEERRAERDAEFEEKRLKVPRKLWQARLDQIIPDTRLMDELVMNFLVHEGFKEGALKFAKESGITAQIDEDSIDSRILIRKLILEG